jgi:phenylalanyl-tRNA synthetase beta chain
VFFSQVFKTVAPSAMLEMHVAPETGVVRPFVVCAVLRGMAFSPETYQSFIDLQDKLHHNICRRRTLVAIGTHDLDTLSAPFSYQAKPPGAIEFVPLSQPKSYSADALMEFYRTDPSVKHIKPFTDIIYSSPLYPVIYDSKGVVLSVPPIINGEHSKIVAGRTKDVFIECTATDLTKANIVLNTMVTMFAQYSNFTVEQVKVTYDDGTSYVTPDLSNREASARVDAIQAMLGVPLVRLCGLVS